MRSKDSGPANFSKPLKRMYSKRLAAAYAKTVGTLCVCVLCIILVAGLWPFHTPKNEVTWIDKGDGLRFGRYGSILSSHTFQITSDDNTSGSIELWLAPNQSRGEHTILSFDSSVHPGVPFSLRQNSDTLVVLRQIEDNHGTSRTTWLPVNGVFREKRPVFVTITLGSQDTLVYVDGVMAEGRSILGASTKNFTGRLIVANSPSVSDSWPGQILGLAIYGRQLTPAQVARHYKNWTKTQRPALAQDEAPVALYLFNERAGDIVHNQLDPLTDLTIPKRYFVLHSAFLAPPWREYHANWGYWEDFGINVAGFIPMGFCVVAYLLSVRATKRAAATTIVLGFATSLTIETLQAFLPTRDSGMTDLITNTLGAAIGVMLYRLPVTQRLLSKAEQYGANTYLSTDTIGGLGTVSADSVTVGTSAPV